MGGHGQPLEHEAEVPATVLGRVAKGIEDVIRPVYKAIGWFGALTIFLVVVAMIYSAIGRRVGSPLTGAVDIQRLGLLIMIALALGVEHMGHEKMVVEAIARFLPKRLQDFIAPVIFLLVNAILVIAVWQLIDYGMGLQSRGVTTRTAMRLPLHPFTYLIAAGVATLIPIYIARLLKSIDRLVKR